MLAVALSDLQMEHLPRWQVAMIPIKKRDAIDSHPVDRCLESCRGYFAAGALAGTVRCFVPSRSFSNHATTSGTALKIEE